MKINDKRIPPIGRGADGLRRRNDDAGRLKESSSAPKDKISAVGLEQTAADAAVDFMKVRRAKVTAIAEQVKSGNYFSSRPDLPSKIAEGLSEEVTLLQDLQRARV
jgi:anti-sigma28 factor (negative regulator of flagellin synthesis)